MTGPTAIGKTDLALELVDYFDSFIISADSRQIYKELSIGTAKPSPEEIVKGKMELVDFVSVTEPYSAGLFMNQALPLIERAHQKGITPILCGGSGLYIKAVCEGLDPKPTVEESVIEELNLDLEQKGVSFLQEELEKKDPEYYSTADVENSYRVIRALSIIRQTGNTFSSYLNQPKTERNFIPIYIVLDMPREQLYGRIDERVIRMMEAGLLDEVKSVITHKNLQSLKTVGYTELFDYLDDKTKLNEAVSLIQRNSRRYAKRQTTWNRNQIKSTAFLPTEKSEIISEIRARMKSFS